MSTAAVKEELSTAAMTEELSTAAVTEDLTTMAVTEDLDDGEVDVVVRETRQKVCFYFFFFDCFCGKFSIYFLIFLFIYVAIL